MKRECAGGSRFNLELFVVTMFLYYSGYCLYNSYMVLYLSSWGYGAFYCGVVTSLAYGVIVLVQPIAGYLTDTFLSVKYYVLVSLSALLLLYPLAGVWVVRPVLCALVLTAMAVFIMPLNYVMDAWVDGVGESDPRISYGKARAGGSVGFGLTAAVLGYLWVWGGRDRYFSIQAVLFFCMLVTVFFLPDIRPSNGRRSIASGKAVQVGFRHACRLLLGDRAYRAALLLFALYWFSHRPVGSYLTLIMEDRGNGAELFGVVCGIGALAEAVFLILIAVRWAAASPTVLLAAALLTNLVRPAVLLCSGSLALLIIAQVVQSLSFALYYTAGVSCFHAICRPEIRSFSVMTGLSFASVAGTASANLLGGWLCDIWGSVFVVWLSLAAALLNTMLYWLFVRWRLYSRINEKIFVENHQ